MKFNSLPIILAILAALALVAGCQAGDQVGGTHLFKEYDQAEGVVCYQFSDTHGISCLKVK